MSPSTSLLRTALSFLALGAPVLSLTSYANEFVDPNLILAKNLRNTTVEAQKTILEWADELAASGPWCMWHNFCNARS